MRRSSARLVAGGALLALAAAACGGSSGGAGGSAGGGSASAPGVTATTVTIGSTQPLTGVAAPGYSEIAPAADAYFKYVNSNGGINGRTITYKYLDDAYDPNQTLQKTQQLILQDKVFAIFNALGTPTHEKVVDFLNQQKVPDLFVASGCLCWDEPRQHPQTFGWQVDYTVEGKILGKYIAEHFKGKKVAYYYQDDDFGANGVKGLDMEIPKSQVVARVPYELTSTNETPLVQKLQRSGADVVVSLSVPAYTALLKLTSVALNYNPQLVVSNVGSDPTTLNGLLEAFAAKSGNKGLKGSTLTQGIITDSYLSSPADPSNSWIQLFKKIHDQYIPNLPLDGTVLYGMSVAYTFAEALAKAGKNPTRDSIVKAVEGGLDPGPGLVPFRFSADSHAGYTGAQIGTIQGDVVKLVGQPETTDDGTGPITAYTTAQQPAPPSGVPTG